MPWPSTSCRSIVSRIGLAIGGGGAGGLGALAVIHRPSTLAIGSAAVIAALAASAVGSICKSLPGIIKAQGDREANRLKAAGDAAAQIIKETTEAQALITRTQIRRELLRAAIESDKAEQIVELLRQQSLDPDLPDGRRLCDDVLAKLLAPPRNSGGGKPDSGPRKPGSGQRKPGSRPGTNVVPIRSDD